MTETGSAPFVETLRSFAAGRIPIAEFQDHLRSVFLEGPTVVQYEDAEPDVVFPLHLECAQYLHLVADPDSPSFDEAEARRLAAAFAAIIETISDEVLRFEMLSLARWAADTAGRLRQHTEGRIDRPGFERFVARRPWSPQLQEAFLELSQQDLRHISKYLDSDDYGAILRALGWAI